MNFKKLFSLSAGFVLTLASGVVLGMFYRTGQEGADKSSAPLNSSYNLLPDLSICTDTTLVTSDNWSKLAAGVFLPTQNKVIVYHFVPADTAKWLPHWCAVQNDASRVVARHEVEHARKANIVQNVQGLSGYSRAQMAIMNETMAPAAEIVEAMTYRMETGRRFPIDRRFLFRADSMIMAWHSLFGALGPMIDLGRPEIADIILRASIDKFVMDYGRGIYHTKVRNELNARPRAKYTPHRYCDNNMFSHCCPQINDWGALWTFEVTPFIKNGNVLRQFTLPRGCFLPCYSVDLWNSATQSARDYVLQKVDSCIMVEMNPGQMLQNKVFTKSR